MCCVCRLLGHLAPVHPCAGLRCCVACAVSWTTLLLFAGALARCLVLLVPCPGLLGFRSPVRYLGALCCLCGLLGNLAPVHRFDRSMGFAVCPGPLGSRSLVCSLSALCYVCGVLGHLAPVYRCARPRWCVACGVSWAVWLLFTGVPALCVLLRVRCPGTLGSCSPVCLPEVWCCVCGVLGHLAPVYRCPRSVRCVAYVVSSDSWLIFTGVPAWCFVLPVRCPGSLGSCLPECSLGALCCMCGVPGHLLPPHRCARSVRCVACAVSWATRLLFAGVPARGVRLGVRCPGPLRPCSPLCPLCVVCFGCGLLGNLAPVYRCATSVRCVSCAVS